MAPKPNSNVVYALAGRALEAAQRLEQELQRELKTVAVMRSGNMKDMGDSWDAMYKGLLERLDREAPEILELTGLKSPATQVFKGAQTLPRAYQEYPQIFASPEKKPMLYMYAPVDYKGAHFVPVDSVPMTGKQADRVGDLLFAGGWLGNAPLVSVRKEGVATPADYKAPGKTALRKAFSHMSNDRVCFLAAGRSLDIVQDYRARTEDWKEKLQTACRAIEAEVGKKKNELLVMLPVGEDVNISVSYSYSSQGGDKATLLLSVRRAGKDSMWNAGKKVDAPESDAYRLTPREGGEYVVKPRRDTPEGKALAAIIDAVPRTPGLKEYPELLADFKIKQDQIGRMLGVNGSIPQVVDVGGYTVLLYTAAPGVKKDSFCPPGAQPFKAEAYEWLRSDEGDRNMSIKSPPMPRDLADLLAKTPQNVAPAQKTTAPQKPAAAKKPKP